MQPVWECETIEFWSIRVVGVGEVGTPHRAVPAGRPYAGRWRRVDLGGEVERLACAELYP